VCLFLLCNSLNITCAAACVIHARRVFQRPGGSLILFSFSENQYSTMNSVKGLIDELLHTQIDEILSRNLNDRGNKYGSPISAECLAADYRLFFANDHHIRGVLSNLREAQENMKIYAATKCIAACFYRFESRKSNTCGISRYPLWYEMNHCMATALFRRLAIWHLNHFTVR